jgi:2-polyprenyl-6-methoxyphenol hydroxylase-like FAD-dependent oxidoreductase
LHGFSRTFRFGVGTLAFVDRAHAPELTDGNRIIIVGAGMAGSLLALTLGRQGQAVSLIDLKREMGPEFRNEKLGIDQIERLDALGVLSCFEEACWGDDADKPGAYRPPLKDCGARYDRWIARVRDALPSTVTFVEGKVDQIETSDDNQAVILASGERIEGRLVALATGRGERLRASLGVSRTTFSERHSLCLGFSVTHAEPGAAPIQAQVHHGRFGDGIAYATIFPMLDEVRINVFSYRQADDPWVARMRADPIGLLIKTLPSLTPVLCGQTLARKLEVRSTDLYAVSGHVQPGVVLLGDAFHAPCPSSGTGMTRILSDVDLLAQHYVPQWLATPGMDQTKIAGFYADPAKKAVDGASLTRSMRGKAAATSKSPYWRVRRSVGALKRVVRPDRTAAVAAEAHA